MPNRTGIGWRLYVGGYDVSGDVGAISSMAVNGQSQDMTALPDSSLARQLTLHDSEITFSVFFNDTEDASHDALAELPTADVLVMVLAGTAAGDPVFCLTGKQINYDWSRPQDGSLTGTVQVQASAGFPLEDAKLLAPRTAHASSDEETGIDHGEQTTHGGVGFLQHFDADSGTVEYDIEDSSDSTDGEDGTWGNLVAFTDVGSPHDQAAERVEVDGNIERWVRAETNGTFTNAAFAMAFRRRIANDYDAA